MTTTIIKLSKKTDYYLQPFYMNGQDSNMILGVNILSDGENVTA